MKRNFVTVSDETLLDCPLKDFFTMRSFAEAAGISHQAVSMAMKRGVIRRAIRYPSWLIHKDELKNFIEPQ